MLAVAGLTAVAFLGGCDSLAEPLPPPSNNPGSDAALGGSPPPGDAGAVGASCHPGNVETFMPASYRHAAPRGQGACVADDAGSDPIHEYYDDCFGPDMSKATCDAFAASNPTCKACIESAEGATAYGPLIVANGFVEANVAGCIEIEGLSNLTCAQAQQALSDCELAACAANCVVVDSTSLLAYETCAAQADDGGCQAYASAAQCLSDEVEGGPEAGPESVCLAPTFEAFYNSVVPIFCGQTEAGAALPPEDASVFSEAGAQGDAGTEPEGGAPDASLDGGSDGSLVRSGDAATPEAGTM